MSLRRPLLRLLPALLLVVLAGCSGLVRWDDAVGPGEYRVRAGDTLYSIALRHDLDYRELAAWNGIDGSYLIRAGQVLKLRRPPGAAPTVVVRNPPRTPAGTPTPGAQRPGTPAPGTQAPGTRTAGTPSTAPPASPPVASGPVAPYRWQWPLTGEIARAFSLPASKGVDIAARQGTAVHAAAPGRVVYSGSALKGYGELIIIKHDERFLSAYGYNRRRLVEEGRQVRAGEVIGEVGMGPANRPMLHFEIRDAGQPVDPLRLLPPVR